MDPVTQILAIIQTICEIYKLWLESLPPEKRAEVAAQQADDMKAWRDFFDKIFKPK